MKSKLSNRFISLIFLRFESTHPTFIILYVQSAATRRFDLPNPSPRTSAPTNARTNTTAPSVVGSDEQSVQHHHHHHHYQQKQGTAPYCSYPPVEPTLHHQEQQQQINPPRATASLPQQSYNLQYAAPLPTSQNIPQSMHQLPQTSHQLPQTSFQPTHTTNQMPQTSHHPIYPTHQLPQASQKLPQTTHQLPQASQQPTHIMHQLPQTSHQLPINSQQLPQASHSSYIPVQPGPSYQPAQASLPVSQINNQFQPQQHPTVSQSSDYHQQIPNQQNIIYKQQPHKQGESTNLQQNKTDDHQPRGATQMKLVDNDAAKVDALRNEARAKLRQLQEQRKPLSAIDRINARTRTAVDGLPKTVTFSQVPVTGENECRCRVLKQNQENKYYICPHCDPIANSNFMHRSLGNKVSNKNSTAINKQVKSGSSSSSDGQDCNHHERKVLVSKPVITPIVVERHRIAD